MKKQKDKRYWGYGDHAWDDLKWRLALGLIVAALCGVWWLYEHFVLKR